MSDSTLSLHLCVFVGRDLCSTIQPFWSHSSFSLIWKEDMWVFSLSLVPLFGTTVLRVCSSHTKHSLTGTDQATDKFCNWQRPPWSKHLTNVHWCYMKLSSDQVLMHTVAWTSAISQSPAVVFDSCSHCVRAWHCAWAVDRAASCPLYSTIIRTTE